ncbi:MAG: Uncharacterised protein [Prochlorococcus marinus str. MIT 9313]|nr:MAG: Uncharacterised protein [Prochlorococcus marinus str. MIT 9313]
MHGINVTDKRDVFFSQVAAGLEAVSDTWNFNAYALVPIGDTEQRLNSHYKGGSLDTYGLDVGYSITPDLNASVGYYYQHGDDLREDDGSAIKGRLAYNISNGLTLGANLSYDEAFDTRFTADIKYRFNSNDYGAQSKNESAIFPTIQALSGTPSNRDVRVHDAAYTVDKCWKYESDETTLNTNYDTETCTYYSTGYESSTDAATTEKEAWKSCTKRAGAFTYIETIKTTNEKVRYKYYCQVNS